jgi:ParB/RepB/Spo0J family partition protein
MKTYEIHRSPFQLRPVRTHTLEFVQLKDSIVRSKGLLQPILVRPSSRHGGYEIVDGAHRHEVYIQLRWFDIPAHVREMTDEEVLRAQVAANVQRIQTLDSDLVKRLVRMAKHTDIRIIASSLGKSVSWVEQVCRFENLKPQVLKLFESGELGFRKAVLLSRIPRKHQMECLGLDEWQLRSVINKLKTERIFETPRAPGSPIFRPLHAVMSEVEQPHEAGRIIASETDGSPIEIWKAALRWVVQLDKQSKKRRKIS